MGMSISVVGYLAAIVLAWITTKAPTFGNLVARRNFADLDHLFFRTLWQAMGFLLFGSALAMLVALWMNVHLPRLADRIVSPAAFALLLVGTLGSVLVQALAIYLRSFKREPFLYQSIAIAALTLLSCQLTATRLGSMGVAASYLLSTGVVGVISGWWIFTSARHSFQLSGPHHSPDYGQQP